MDATVTAPSAQWIDADNTLADALARWADCPALAVDTEFVRTDTFFAKLGLVQISDGQRCALIDPLAVDSHPLFQLLGKATITKVLHSGSEDLGIFLHQGKIHPRPLFDTQIAAALLGLGSSLSYPALLNTLLGIELDKGEQRSDWLQRPLSDAQKHYAANDVEHLLEVYDILAERLDKADRRQWLDEDSEALIQAVAANHGAGPQYARFKMAWKLDSVGRLVLFNLLDWRERDAIRLDRPRTRVLHDDALLDIAFRKPTRLAELNDTPRMSPGLRRTIGPRLIELVEAALAAPTDQHPAAPPRPLGPESKSVMKVLKAIVNERAEGLGIAPEILCSRREYVSLIRDHTLPPKLQGWRQSVVGDELLAAVTS